ncbi:MAG TPA: hypothetical protein VH575_04165 [Gemmataceae bacterium]
MPIKFTCPHCKRAMVVPDSLAGKKGRCKACQKILTVPNPATAKPPAKGQPNAAAPKIETPAPAPPPPRPADVEAEAAALFADEPKTEEPVEVKNIELNCPFCDEPIHFPVGLAGKREPCPECRRIIKVPELVKKEPKDWRKADQRGPAGARLPDQPALEGAWGSSEAGRVGRKTLEEVGVIAKTKPPRTLWQKVRWPAAGVTAFFLVVGLSWGGYRWWVQRGIERALKEALDYAASPNAVKEVGATGQAALYMGAGEFYLRSKTVDNKDGPAGEVNKQIGKAITTLQAARSDDERDAVLTDLALALVELGGPEAEAHKGLRLSWQKTQPLLATVLNPVPNPFHDPEARREAVRAVCQRLIERGETKRVLQLVNQVYSEPNDEQAAALSVVGVELFKAGKMTEANQAADSALELYSTKKAADDNAKDKEPKKEEKRPRLRAEVVALAKLLDKPVPRLDEDAEKEDKANERIGQVEGLARKGDWDAAKRKAADPELDERGRFRALLALAAVDLKSADAAGTVDNAIQAAEKLGRKPELSWSFLCLTKLALAAGLPEDRVQTLADNIIAKPALRGRAQLAVFRARLAKAQKPIEESVADKIDPKSLSRTLAAEDLARRNTRLGTSWADKVKAWPQPRQAFGALGVALGMQDRDTK